MYLVDRNVLCGVTTYIYNDRGRFTASADVIGHPQHRIGATYHDTREQAEERCSSYFKELLPYSLKVHKEELARKQSFVNAIENKIKELS